MFSKIRTLLRLITFSQNRNENQIYKFLVLRFTENVSEFFGPVMAVYYLFHLVTGCLMLLEMSAGVCLPNLFVPNYHKYIANIATLSQYCNG